MAKEILLYNSINSYSTEEFVNALNATEDGESAVVRVNNYGGDTSYGFAMVAKFAEYPGDKIVKVDGIAASMAAFFTLYAREVEALSVSQFMFHRASYGEYYEKNYMQPDEKKSLERTNKDLRSALEARVNPDEWLSETGVSLDQMFSLDDRIDVTLTADQAKKLGIVTKIKPITPEIRASVERDHKAFASASGRISVTGESKSKKQTIQSNIMTIQELKKDHPELYAQAVQAGVKQERDRVEAIAELAGSDETFVKEKIASGEALTKAEEIRFLKKHSEEAIKKAALKGLKADGTPEIDPENEEDEEPQSLETKAEKEAKKINALVEKTKKNMRKSAWRQEKQEA